MSLRHPVMFLSDNLTKRYSHTKIIWYTDKSNVRHRSNVRERASRRCEKFEVCASDVPFRESHQKMFSHKKNLIHISYKSWGAIRMRCIHTEVTESEEIGLQILTTEEIGLRIITTAKISNNFSLESLYISNSFSKEAPNFQTIFHVSKCSPWVNAVHVTQKIDQENWSISRSTYSKSDLLCGWEMRCDMTRSHCDMTRSHVSESSHVASHLMHLIQVMYSRTKTISYTDNPIQR